MAIDGARIQRITKEGLFYLDENGEKVFIDFQACYERKLAEFMQPENLKHFREINRGASEEQLDRNIEERKDWKYVADRSIIGFPFGNLPWIMFYTDPPIRFKFETREKFEEVRYSIEFLSGLPPNSATADEIRAFFDKQTGWLTFDLS